MRQVQEERDEAQAIYQRALSESTQTLADQGVQQLRQELGNAQQELESLRSQGGVLTPAASTADLQPELQKAQDALAVQQATSPDVDLQNRVAALEQECTQAQVGIQGLLGESRALQTKYEELQKQKVAPSDVRLTGRLRLADLEVTRLCNQVKMEADFSQKQVGEVDCLGNEVKWLQPDKDQLWDELKSIKDAQVQMTVTKATYSPASGTGVPPVYGYGSPLPSHATMLGQFSPNVMQYEVAAAQAGRLPLPVFSIACLLQSG